MKILIAFLFTFAAFAQSPGTITVASNITVTAGASTDSTQIVCTGTAGVVSGASTMTMTCTVGGKTVVLPLTTFTVPASPGVGVVFGVQAGANSITWILTKGNPAPDQWQVSANGTLRSQAF